MIKLIKPAITFEEVSGEFKEIFDSGMFTCGKYSKALPEEMCRYTGAKFAFNATSATTALSAALEAVGVRAGDEVIVSDFSFPATCNVVEAAGARCVFADVSRETYNMLPGELEKKITPKTKAVIFVCGLGNPSGILEIRDICKSHGVPLIDDAACGAGSSVSGVKVGNMTDIECFSYHPRKLLTAGEGGAITTSRTDYADFLSVKLMHGSVPTDTYPDFVTYGYNYRLPELQCVMVLHQLARLDEMVQLRLNLQKRMTERLAPGGYVQQKADENVVHNVQSLVYTAPASINRDQLRHYLYENGVESTLGTYCLSDCTYYKKKYQDVQPNALYLQQHTLTLPCYEGVDVDYIADTILRYRP